MVFPIYRGYSTVNNPSLDTTIFDMELVKADLMNHFMTKLGDRPMRATFGSIIWDLLFDVFDDRTESLVLQDAERIIDDDPRVDRKEIKVFINQDTHEVKVEIKLLFVEFDMEDWFVIEFVDHS